MDNGQWYDWRRTLRPERPWRNAYDHSLVAKLFLAEKNPDGLSVKRVHLTFDAALDVIRRLDERTPGVPKIVYLVGWQSFGHDAGYPAWDRVNEALKSPQDATALDTLRRVIRQAREHNTAVSLHVNMIDATPTSPLWQEYRDARVVIANAEGVPIPGEVFSGEQSYQLSYFREWQTGLALRRIDGLLAMIPELVESGTLHLDAFHSKQPVRRHELNTLDSVSHPQLGITCLQEVETQRRIFRAFRDRGIDVTCENSITSLRFDPFIGLQPMAWHLEEQDFWQRDWIGKPRWFFGLPRSLYCGVPFQLEQPVLQDPVAIPGLDRAWKAKIQPWLRANRRAAERRNRGT